MPLISKNGWGYLVARQGRDTGLIIVSLHRPFTSKPISDQGCKDSHKFDDLYAMLAGQMSVPRRGSEYRLPIHIPSATFRFQKTSAGVR